MSSKEASRAHPTKTPGLVRDSEKSGLPKGSIIHFSIRHSAKATRKNGAGEPPASDPWAQLAAISVMGEGRGTGAW
jgi:hypothetical protein